MADRIRNQLLRVKDVAKVELVGEQEEKIFVELANAKLATFGIEPASCLRRARAAERRGRHRELRDPNRSHLHPRERGARVGRGGEGHRHPRQRAALPAGRRGDRAPRLRRPAAAAHALHGARGARHRGSRWCPRGDIVALGRSLDAEIVRIEASFPWGSSSTA
jgi:multidrug efflux pump